MSEDGAATEQDAGPLDGSLGISADELKRLALLVETNGLSELRLVDGDIRVTLRTAMYRAAARAEYALPAPQVFRDGSAPVARESKRDVSAAPAVVAPGSGKTLLQIEAPIMGVFYRSASPGDSALVEIGDVVEVGQPVGVIEAMKVFSEVPADHAGRVIEIPAQNGGLIQPGEPLIILEALV